MACRLFGAKLLSTPMLGYCQLDLRNKLQWNFNQSTKLFIHENAFENIVYEMVAICPGGGQVSLGKYANDFCFSFCCSFTATNEKLSILCREPFETRCLHAISKFHCLWINIQKQHNGDLHYRKPRNVSISYYINRTRRTYTWRLSFLKIWFPQHSMT